MKKLLIAFIMAGAVGCAPKVRTSVTQPQQALDYKQEVLVLEVDEQAPASATELGKVKIGDNGFSTHCKWEQVLEKAKTEARKAGGNVLKITEHKRPSALGSSCHRIAALILKLDDPQALAKLEATQAPLTDSTWDYAKLYVYRNNGAGMLVGYDLYLGDSLICRVKNNSRQEIRLTNKGLNRLWARTEAKEEIPIDVTFGREYFLRCGINMGVVVGRPSLELVDSRTGKKEYERIKPKR